MEKVFFAWAKRTVPLVPLREVIPVMREKMAG